MTTEWYKKVYDNLIESRKERGLNKRNLIGYYEKHHIIPKCLGGTDDLNNYVLLTYKEHVFAHTILHKIYPNDKKLMKALTRMMTCEVDLNGVKKKREIKSLKEAEYLKKLYVESLSGEGNPNFGKKGKLSHRYGKHLSQESKNKISKANKGKLIGDKNPMYGVRLTGDKNPMYGKFYGNHPAAKKIIDPNGKIFSSLKECSEFHKLDRHTISKWIKNKPEKGFKFI